MRPENFITWLLAPLGFLLIAGGLAFQQFQVWAVTQQANSVPTTNSLVYKSPEISSKKDLIDKPSKTLKVESEIVTQLQTSKVAERDVTIKPAVKVVAPNLQEKKSVQEAIAQVDATLAEPKLSKPALVNEPVPVQLVQQNSEQAFDLHPVLSEHLDHLLLDFDSRIVSEQNLKRAVARVLLSPDPYAELNLISRDPFNYKARPAYYRQVINHKNQPIRYPREAMEYAEFLVKPYLKQVRQKQDISLKIPLRESNLAYPARRYESWVMQFARDFRVSPALVLAIMETESNFDPKAVSRSKAKGLMQIKPNSAGRDVYKYVDLKFGAPSDAELFDEASNIRMGTAYLSLLKYEYFADIRNPDIKEMIAISSYNGGLSTVWKLFGSTPEEAIQKINRLRPQQVYRTLRYEHASDETRRYIDKVLQAKNRYKALLGEDARILAAVN